MTLVGHVEWHEAPGAWALGVSPPSPLSAVKKLQKTARGRAIGLMGREALSGRARERRGPLPEHPGGLEGAWEP